MSSGTRRVAVALLVATLAGGVAKAAPQPALPWSSGEPPMFSPLTLPSGHIYTLVQAGSLQPRTGERAAFVIFYAGASRTRTAATAAAEELLQAWQPLAERQHHDALVVVAYFDVGPGEDLSEAPHFATRYERRPDGVWQRSPTTGDPPPAQLGREAHHVPATDQRGVAAARLNAQQWLRALDESRLRDTWDTASVFFQSKVAYGAWMDAVTKIREAKGRTVGRRLLMSLERQQVPGMPVGPYVALDFASKLEKAEGVVERVSMRLCEDGHWRVAGYSVY